MFPLPSTSSEILSNGMYANDQESYLDEKISLSMKSNSIIIQNNTEFAGAQDDSDE